MREGKRKQRSPASGYVVSHRSSGNCAATVSVRSAVAVRPEQEDTAVPLPVSSSHAAVMVKQPGLVVRSNRRVPRVRSRFSRSASETEGEGRRVAVLGLVATSVILVLVVRDAAPCDGFLVKRTVRSVVRDTAPWLGIPGEAHHAPRKCPSRTPIGRARLDPSESIRLGRAVRRAGLDPMRPVPGPGTGPSRFLGRETLEKA